MDAEVSELSSNTNASDTAIIRKSVKSSMIQSSASMESTVSEITGFSKSELNIGGQRTALPPASYQNPGENLLQEKFNSLSLKVRDEPEFNDIDEISSSQSVSALASSASSESSKFIQKSGTSLVSSSKVCEASSTKKEVVYSKSSSTTISSITSSSSDNSFYAEKKET